MIDANPKAQAVSSTRPAPFSQAFAHELLAEYGSPLYVYDADALRATIRRIGNSVPYPHARFHFASVTNGNVSLLRIFRESGWGLHANTPGDAHLGLQAGFAPAQMVYSGSNLNRDEMAQMLAWGVGTLNLDSLSQLELLREVYRGNDAATAPRIGFRINLPEVTGESRIGVRPAEFPEAARMAGDAGLKISGIHFYRGTGTNSTAAFTRSIAAVLEAGRSLPDWEYLDFGGGFGYPYRDDRAGFDWEEFGAELARQVMALDRPLELLIEPGRAAIAGCGTLLARVVSVKWQDKKQIVGVDTSVANIAVLSVHGGYREIRALRDDAGGQYVTDVCGNTTFSRDYLGRGCMLPALQADDMIAILDVGAYGYAMSSHFLHRPRPAEVLVEDGAHRLIRRRESYEALTAHQVPASEAGA
ncbi:MAG TPA: decarboxylase [Blastocatellia bacterium]|nr:decarboxylase [Blastocatellia bacterium]